MKQWFGGNDYRTSPSHFSTTKGNALNTEPFAAVVARLKELERDAVVELIYIDDESENLVIAYRFVSDAYYEQHMPALMQAGGKSLGRGVWNPWGDDYQYYEFFGCPNGQRHGCTDYNSCMELRRKK